MKRTMFLLQLTIAIALIEGLSFSQNKHMYEDETVSVITTNGEVVGKHAKVSITSENSTTDVYVQIFQGIPFAQPPIGKLRFRPPTEPEPWVEKLLALKPSKSCLQLGINGSTMILDTSEDCLYLNVWVPLPVQKDAAVMVWIYGGGFSMGTTALYDFERFAATEGVIVVSMNYRVNSLGFLYFGNEDCPGNMGLKDQELALKWVRKNIDRFGGDPEKVTIFGQSAGSMSASYHLLNPNSQKLFKRAILQSGPPGSPFWSDTQSEASEKSLKVAQVVGCGSNLSNLKATLECLREVDGNLLVQASTSLVDFLTPNHLPVVDHQMVFESPSKTVNALKGKEVMLGFTSNDGAFIVYILMMFKNILPNDIHDAFLKNYLGDVSEEVLKSVRFYYKDHCNVAKDFQEEIATARLSTDLLFMCSTQDLAHELAKSGIKTFMYQWTHRPLSSQWPVWVKADHGAEVPFLLGTVISPAEVELSRRIMRYWASFAKHGNPNVGKIDEIFNEKIEPWPWYTLARKDRLDIGLSSVRAYEDIQENQCHFWKHDYPLISGKSRIKSYFFHKEAIANP